MKNLGRAAVALLVLIYVALTIYNERIIITALEKCAKDRAVIMSNLASEPSADIHTGNKEVTD